MDVLLIRRVSLSATGRGEWYSDKEVLVEILYSHPCFCVLYGSSCCIIQYTHLQQKQKVFFGQLPEHLGFQYTVQVRAYTKYCALRLPMIVNTALPKWNMPIMLLCQVIYFFLKIFLITMYNMYKYHFESSATQKNWKIGMK